MLILWRLLHISCGDELEMSRLSSATVLLTVWSGLLMG